MTVRIEARDFAFVPETIEAPAGTAFDLAFTNSDAAVPHNVTIASNGTNRFSGKIVSGVTTVRYAIPALAAGTYTLGCIVHPAMAGTLTAR